MSILLTIDIGHWPTRRASNLMALFPTGFSPTLRSSREKRRPLLFNFCAATLRALHLALVVVGESQNAGEFLVAG